MKRLVAGTLLLSLFPFATAQEPPKAAPAAAAPQPGAPFFARFDLNKDGKVDWDEYRKVKSGFAMLDVDGDGVITQPDIAKLAERRRQRMQKAMQRRMMREGQRGRGRWFGPPAHERRGFMPWGPRGRGESGPGQQGWRGQRGPMGPGAGRGWGQRGGRGMGWGFGEEWDEPTPPPPPPR
jgi:hypothetical protein